MPSRGYNFTERVRNVLALAREEAAALGHEYVGTEHALLALIREGQGVATTVLIGLGVDLGDLDRRVREVVSKGRGRGRTGPDLPYTSRAKKALELAMVEARDMDHEYVGTEHLLLGLIREEKGIAAVMLLDCGLSPESVREETLKLLGGDTSGVRDDATLAVRPRDILQTSGRPDGLPAVRSLTLILDFGQEPLLARKFKSVDEAIQFLQTMPKREG
jgi:ATP-dependent Clp protease ATP-binding subunit ClpC